MCKSILVLKLLNQYSKITNYFLLIFFRYERHLCIRCCQTHTSGRNIYVGNRSVSELACVAVLFFIFSMGLLLEF